MRKLYFIFLIIISIASFGQADTSNVNSDKFILPPPNPELHLDISAPLNGPYLSAPYLSGVSPVYSAVYPPDVIYAVPTLSYSHAGSSAIVTRGAQLGCGQFYTRDYYDAGLYKIIELEHQFGVTKYLDTIIPTKWDQIESVYPDNTKNYVVKKGTSYGLINEKDSLIYEVIYDSITPVSDEKYRCKHHLELFKFYKNDSVGIGNVTGKWVLKPKNETVELMYHRWHCPQYYAVYKVGKNGSFGVRDSRDNIYVPIQYDELYDYKEVDLPVVSHYSHENDVIIKAKKGDSLFVFNRKRIVIRSDFEEIQTLWSEGDFSHFKFKRNGKWGVIRKKDTVVANLYDEIALEHSYPRYYKVKLDELYGVVNANGKEIVPIKFEGVNRLSDSCFQVEFNHFINLYDVHGNLVLNNRVEKLKKLEGEMVLLKGPLGYGLYNTRMNKMIGDFDHDYPAYLFEDRGADWRHKNMMLYSLAKYGKFGAIGYDGELLIPYKYDEPILLKYEKGSDPYFLLKTSDSIFHMRSENDIVGFAKDEEIDYRYWRKKLLLVSKKTTTPYVYKVGLRNEKGGVIVPNEYRNIFVDIVDSDTLFLATLKDSTLTFYKDSIKGKTITVDMAFQSRTQDVHTRNGDLRGKINLKGEWVTEPRLETYKVFTNGVKIGLNRKGRYSFFDKDDKRMDAFEYHSVMVLDGGIVQAKKHAKTGILDSLGKEIIPFIHAKIKVYDSIYAAKKSKYYALFDKEGKRLTDYAYSKVKYQYKNMVCVRMKDRFGIVDLNGKELLAPISYYKIDVERLATSEKYMITTSDGKRYINSKFEITKE
jgi:hypothetical protein